MTSRNPYGTKDITGDIKTFMVNPPQINAKVTYLGERCIVLQTATYQDEPGKFTHRVTLLPIGENGEDLGKGSISAQFTENGLIW